MTRILKSKFRLDRRSGVNILGRSKSPINTRGFTPGVHKKDYIKRKLSDYGKELMEIRKFRFFYCNIRFREIKRIFKRVKKFRSKTIDKFISILERRLVNFVYRIKWAATPFGARQLVSHCKIKVNGKEVNIASYELKVGDTVELNSEAHTNPHVTNAMNSGEVKIPEYIKSQGFSGLLITDPVEEIVSYPYKVDFSKIITVLSRY